MSTRATIAFLMGLGAFSGAALALAQSAEEEARKAFEQGLAEEQAGRAKEACVLYRKSLGLVRELGPLRKVATCDQSEGKVVAARAELEELLARLPEGSERAALQAELASVQKRIARVSLALRAGAPADVRVKLDGRDTPVPSEAVELDPGAHELVVAAGDAAPEVVRFEVAEGETRRLEVPGEPKPQVAPPPASPRATEGPGTSGLAIAGWVVGGVGAAGLVAAGITGGLVVAKSSDYDACTTACDDLQSEGDTLLAANAVSFGVGIVGVGVGATLLLVDALGGDPEPSPQAGWTVEVAPGYAGLRARF